MKEKMKGGISSVLHKIVFLVVGITSLGSTFIAQAADNTAFLTTVNYLLLCQDGCGISYTVDDPKYNLAYKGLSFYKSELPHTQYQLPQLSESEFNRLSLANKRKVADKLLTSLFFGYPFKELEAQIASGHFLCSVRKGLTQEKNNMAAVEEEILNEERYYHSEWANNEVLDILARFHAMEHLDKHYLNNWIAYILT